MAGLTATATKRFKWCVSLNSDRGRVGGRAEEGSRRPILPGFRQLSLGGANGRQNATDRR